MSESEDFLRELPTKPEGADGETPSAEPARTDAPRAFARAAVWLLALTVTVVGVVFCVIRRLVIEDPDVMDEEIEIIDLTGLGAGLLCVGLLILAAVLIAEAYASPSARSRR